MVVPTELEPEISYRAHQQRKMCRMILRVDQATRHRLDWPLQMDLGPVLRPALGPRAVDRGTASL
eukprot:1604761-Pyramimonas_sp.AAC.1